MKWQGELLISAMKDCSRPFKNDIYRWQDEKSYTQQCYEIAMALENMGFNIVALPEDNEDNFNLTTDEGE